MIFMTTFTQKEKTLTMSSNAALIPSQTLNATAGSFHPNPPADVSNSNTANNNANEGKKKPRNRRNNKKKPSDVPQSSAVEHANTSPQQQQRNGENNERPNMKNRRRGGNQVRPNNANPKNVNVVAPSVTANNTNSAPTKKKPARKRSTTNNNMKHPWRREIPEGAMDPITLDPLVSLAYPPFALCAQAPYTPVHEWPPPVKEEQANPPTQEDRELKILQQQWGNLPAPKEAEAPATQQRHFNLYDGRALAYYLVSQLQFIDPLNRRDLTRDELVTLDHYLSRHGFDKKFKVVEAYDAKGITVSTAGAQGNTAAGRATILQQQAQVLLNSMFAGPTSVLQQQYAASEQQDRNNRRRSTATRQQEEDVGIYGDDGLIIIDDDYNPGLRGGGFQQAASSSGNGNGDSLLWSASHITSQYSHAATVQEHNFPALSAPPPPSQVAAAITSKPTKKSAPTSKSLLRITKVVTKTSAKELERQREAREAFVKRAQMSNLSLTGDGAVSTMTSQQQIGGIVRPPSLVSQQPTEGQLLRNQAFATALGVAPATVRQQALVTGWARPTKTSIELDEFGNELNAANYPDALIMKARERMELTVKMERKWTKFLEDDKAASLPLTSMDRPTRVFVHEYSDFWKLHTESFDPEPKRYIHCVKLRDTSVPRPLLSEAARNWQGPRLVTREQEHPIKQTAGQAPREFPPPPDRDPLPLQPRTLPIGFVPPPGAMYDMDVLAAPLANTRSSELFSGRERPKLQLAARTLPVEEVLLPEPDQTYSIVEERERQRRAREERARLEQSMEEKKRRALESAFASDSEAESLASHDSDEWDDVPDQQAQYTGSDEDE